MTKIWCKHIKWDRDYEEDPTCYHWQLTSGTCYVTHVTKSWKVCPICQTERPNRANKKAASLRFEMDNDL